MKTRFFSLAAIAVLLLNVAGFAVGDTKRALAKKRQATRLVAMLPASDGIAIFDAKRFLTEGLPKVLSANQPLLTRITEKIGEMEQRTGIDFRKFEQVAVGVAMIETGDKKVDLEPVAIASGDINAGALIAVARLASKGAYREEKIGSRTVYVFSPKDLVQNQTVTTNSKIANHIEKALNSFTKDVAVAAFDKNTLVIGTLPRVRETLEARSRVAADVSSLLSVKETAVASFALKTPGGMSKLLPLDGDALGVNIDAIQYVAGSVDIATIGTSLHMMARTKKAEQALELKDTIEVLQGFGKIAFGNSKRPDQQVYSRLIRDAKIEARGTDLTLDLLVQQSDIDILVSGIK